MEIGKRMHELITDLFPICRSITGDGVRETLARIKEVLPALKIHEVPTGTKAFDWTVPKEWNIRDAYVLDGNGEKIIDFEKSNLHVVGYSVPVDKDVSLAELQEHLHSLEDRPEAIPYVTSYYKERWGFCIAHNEREKLKEGTYHVHIDSELTDGNLTYGELIISGKTEKEILLSTYVCHPSMANNELSGPAVTAYLAKWIQSKPRTHTYRIVFIPETIGSITYLSKNLEAMKKNTIAGFNITCVGDDRAYSYLPSRDGKTYADRIALKVLGAKAPGFVKWTYLDRGSDERQYNAPGVDLPVVSIMRSKYESYPEYHTSLDDLDLVTPQGLAGAYDVLKGCITLIEENARYRIACLGEPQMGKHGLYPTLSKKSSSLAVKEMMDFIGYCDGTRDLDEISELIKVPVERLKPIIADLRKAKLLDPAS